MKTKLEKRVVFERSHIFLCAYKNLHNLPHWHGEHELVLVRSGRVSLTVNDTVFALTEGMCAFLHGEEIHCIQSEPTATVAVAKADAAYFDRIIGAKRLQSPILTGAYALFEVFAELFAEQKNKGEYSGIIADGIATVLLARIFAREPLRVDASPHGKSDMRYKQLLDLIATEYPYITFEEAVAYMNFSKPYFSKYFYRYAGMTFTQYLNTIKIGAAVEKLQQDRMTVTEVSQSCGFNTIRHFNRVFKELTGYAPNQLPPDYVFLRNLKEYADTVFDPTLSISEILDME